MENIKWSKWLALGLGGIVGVSHIGMIGLLSNRESKLPSINVPVGPYTAYEAEVGRDGYRISYRANDPKGDACGKGCEEKRWVSGVG